MDLRARRGLIGSKITGSRLPAEYQEVEYLESTGTQQLKLIDSVSPYFKIRFKMMPTVLKASDNYFYGTYGNWLSFEWNSSDSWGGTAYWNIGSSVQKLRHVISVNTVYEYDITYNNGVLIVSGSYNGQAQYNGTLGTGPLSFFCKNNNVRFSSERLYYLRLYQGENYTIANDFIPCYRKSDSKPGMYDLVSGEFFTNSGTGEFLVGPDVN